MMLRIVTTTKESAPGLLIVLAALWACLPLRAQTELRLEAAAGMTNSALRLTSSVHENFVLTLEASTNLLNWTPTGVFHDGLFAYPDLASTRIPSCYYRLFGQERVATNDWKNQLLLPDPFLRFNDSGDLGWAKFAIVLEEPGRVYFQDGRSFPFHYDFAVNRLARFHGLDRASFDTISLHRTNQQIVLGAVLVPQLSSYSEYGVQFVGLEAYTPEEIGRWFTLVTASIHSDRGAAAYYVPTYEQSEPARTNKAAFDALGIPVSSVDRWLSGEQAYAAGWALGELKFFAGADIAAAFSDGRLRPEDILLTDGVPAETPPVAGIITLRPSTPNSHTAILARSFGIPFVYFPDSDEQSRLLASAGRKVILRATVRPDGRAELAVVDVQNQLTAEQETELLRLKEAKPILYLPKASYGALTAPAELLNPSDIRFFGGKAANYGFLRRLLASNSPPAIALSFDLWDGFMEQVPVGFTRTLRKEIASRLAAYTNFPPDIPQLKQTLADIRDLIRNATTFSAVQQQAITNALQVFRKDRKIRFRSSTNVEDSENFTGAGLYDSYSGCLLDDLDADTTGPSLCDPSEPAERGVFRAIRRVYASFYNDNAFLERLRHGVPESEVAMGVLVHHSFPDEDELANGVATLDWNFTSATPQVQGELVTQKGAVSVTNPDGSSVPETVKVEAFGGSLFLTLTRYSSLVPLGARVLEWQEEYESFVRMFGKIAEGYHAQYPAKAKISLDFEYKKDRQLGLVVKQVREVADAPTAGTTTAFLVNEPITLTVAQQEIGNVFANHRLKSALQVTTGSMWLVPSNLTGGIYSTGSLDYLQAGRVEQLIGDMASWPDATVTTNGLLNTWRTGPITNSREWRLETELQTETEPSEPPILVQSDFPRRLTVNYQLPVPTMDPWLVQTNTSVETVFLEPKREVGPGCTLIQRSISVGNVKIDTSFYWPPPPKGVVAGYTAPLVKFVMTTISGLTATPISLTNYYSQTYRPQHHNFSEEFIFEPALDPGLSPALRAELERLNVELLYAAAGSGDKIIVLGRDGKFRAL